MGGVRRRKEDGQVGMEEKSLSPQRSAVRQPRDVSPSLCIAITSFQMFRWGSLTQLNDVWEGAGAQRSERLTRRAGADMEIMPSAA
jgi:hypothetical protein